MAARRELALLLDAHGEGLALLSPGVGLFTAARAEGDLMAAGAYAGVLMVLGEAIPLVVPGGVEGRVTSVPPPRTRHPVGWGEPLYRVEPVVGARDGVDPLRMASSGPERDAALHRPTGKDDAGRLLVRSPQSGRLFLRPTPDDEPFAATGSVLGAGQPIALIEVMKTFAHVPYAGPGLPPRARVVRVLVEDGAEVAAGDPLLEVVPVEAAPS